MDSAGHTIFQRLTSGRDARGRHLLLHELEQRLARSPRDEALATKVHTLVARGMPYFSPEDGHYRRWAMQVAQCWQRLDELEAGAPGRVVSGA
jgi:hypothetical protein